MTAPLIAVKRAAQQVCAGIAEPNERALALADLIDAIVQEARRMSTPPVVCIDAQTRALAVTCRNRTDDADAAHALLVNACGNARLQASWLSMARIERDTPPSIAFLRKEAP